MRPESVTLQLYADGAAYGEPVTLTSANAGSNASIWTYSFTGLPKTAGNNSTTPIVWTVKEVGTPENYQKTEEGLTVTNTHETLTTERTVQKKWEDNNDQDGIRPASVTIHLIGKIGDETVYTSEDIVLSEANNWTETIDKLQVYNTQKMVQYTWEEVVPDGYTVSYGEETDTTTVITNKHTPEKVQFTVNKIWNDNDNADGNRPESLDVKLSADGTVINTYTLEGTKWEITTEEFDKYKNGTEINYTWSEVTDGLAELGYTPNGDPVVNGSTITFTNNYTALTHEITVTKIWVDDDNHDGLRPDEVTFTVSGSDETYTAKLTGTTNTWTAEITVKTLKDGKPVDYEVDENEVENYTKLIDNKNLTITNTHENEKTKATIKKTWEDNNNADGNRPASLTVKLMNGDTVVKIVTLSDDNNWTYTEENLDVYVNGTKANYTWEEELTDEAKTLGYAFRTKTFANDITTFFNNYEKQTVSSTVTKIWVDNNNADHNRPANLTVTLYKNNEATDTTVTLSNNNNWTETVENLALYENGKMNTYSWQETLTEETKALGYEQTDIETKDNNTTITNTYKKSEIELTVTKVWEDNKNQDGYRPDEVTFTVTGSDGAIYEVTVTGTGETWTAKVENVRKYYNGEEVTFTVAEDAVAEYTTTYDQTTLTVTNTHEVELVDVKVTKVWEDDNNKDKNRPAELVVNLLADGEATEQTVTLSDDNNWTDTIRGLDKYKNGTEIKYTWEEILTDAAKTLGYSQKSNVTTGYETVITNEYKTVIVEDLTVTKVWEDNKNQDGFRPASVKFTVTGSDGATYEVTVTGAGETWTAKVDNVRKYYNGEEVTFTVAEDAVAEYTTTYDQTTLTVTNTHEVELVDVKVTKVWEDDNNKDQNRPTSLQVNLIADGNETGKVVTLNEGNNWTATIEDLDRYKDGTEIKYTWEETLTDAAKTLGYSQKSNVTTGYETVITNEYKTVTVEDLTVTKVWEDNKNQDGFRPSEVKFTVTGSDRATYEVTVTGTGETWTANVENVRKYYNGEEVTFTVAEDAVAEYTTTYDQTTLTVTNTHEVELVDVKVTKVWEDDNNKDQNRPTSLQVNLIADGNETGKVVTLNEGNNWTATIEDLDRYKDGTEIKYTWEETLTDAAKTLGYSQKSNVTTGYETVITNEYKTVTVEDLTVTKVWEDNKNQDGFRPTEVKFTVTGSDRATYEVTVTGTGETWTANVENVRKYYNGEEVTFTVAEDAVAEYTTTYDQTTLTVTNTHTPEKTERSIVKIWDDNDNQDRLRPDSITVNLMNGETIVGTVVLSERNQWSDTLSNLPKRANGEEINYTWEEVLETDEYELTDTTTDGALTTLTNTHEVYKVEVEVTKTWVGDEDEIANRTESITVVLVADGEVTENEIVLNAENNWTGKFENLDKFNDGEEIEYTVKEIDVENYVSQITGTAEDGYTITNTYDITNVSVEKVWTGDEDHLDDRPESVTVVLVADGEPTDMTAILLENNEWKASFEGLKKYNVEEDGKLTEIVYTIEELETEGYLSAITGDQENGYTVTNTYNLIDIKVEKVWVEKTHKYRPDSVHVSLLANGAVVAEADLSKDNNWQYVFEDLAIYTEDNKKIEYTVEETAIENYKATITGSAEEGFVVSNKLDGKIDVPDTGDNNAPVYGSIVSVTSLILLAISIVMKKKYEYLH